MTIDMRKLVVSFALRDDVMALAFEGSTDWDTYYGHHDSDGCGTTRVALGEHYYVLGIMANGTVGIERGVHEEDLGDHTIIVNEYTAPFEMPNFDNLRPC